MKHQRLKHEALKVQASQLADGEQYVVTRELQTYEPSDELPVYTRGEESGPPLDNEPWVWWRLIRPGDKVRRLTDGSFFSVGVGPGAADPVTASWQKGQVMPVSRVNGENFDIGPFRIAETAVRHDESWQPRSALGVHWELIAEDCDVSEEGQGLFG